MSSCDDVLKYRRSVILPSMFPSNERNGGETSSDSVQDDFMVLGRDAGGENISGSGTEPSGNRVYEDNAANLENNQTPDNDGKDWGQFEETSNLLASDGDGCKVEASGFPLERCMRIVPHDQNTGAFFIAVLQKISSLRGNRPHHLIFFVV